MGKYRTFCHQKTIVPICGDGGICGIFIKIGLLLLLLLSYGHHYGISSPVVASAASVPSPNLEDNWSFLEDHRLNLLQKHNQTELSTSFLFKKRLQNCTSPSADDFPKDIFTLDAKRHGAIIIHILVALYMFYAIIIVCDAYFVPSVEIICNDWHIPSDIGGATFMAISTSAPELFTNVIGTFLTDTDLGTGTIVGSAVFNILIVGASCGLCGATYSLYNSKNGVDSHLEKKGVKLEWWPLTRDCSFYLTSVILLICILSNQRVYWTEAVTMVLLYAVYVLVLCFNSRGKLLVETLLQFFCSLCFTFDQSGRRISVIVQKIVKIKETTPLILPTVIVNNCPSDVKTYGTMGSNKKEDNKNVLLKTSNVDIVISKEYSVPNSKALDEMLISNAISRSNSFVHPHQSSNNNHKDELKSDSIIGCILEGKRSSCWSSSKSWRSSVDAFASWPIRTILHLTVPDCHTEEWRRWYGLTLAMCVAWIAVLTYIVTWMIAIIGETFSIPDSVTGLTFLAAGTSIPEVISSVIVARQGLGCMGFSNTVGSNTFDLLICLGLPWLIKSSFVSLGYIEIHSGGLEYSAVILVSSVAILYGAIALNGFVLDRKVGIGCILMYIVFITFACMLEMNVFFPVNLPPCD